MSSLGLGMNCHAIHAYPRQDCFSFFRESSQELFAQVAHRFWGHQGPGFCSAHARCVDTSQLVMRLLFVILGTGTASTTAAVVLRDDRSLGKVVHCVLSIHGLDKLCICCFTKLLSYSLWPVA